ncbi:MAG: DUF4340 domain-containing protein [Planctomycetales bacterium]|nr:DUF4340 domain-containing protein [Planctomycetales bacterium]
MSDRKLVILGIAALIMVGWAILQNRIGRSVNTANFSSSPLVEGLQIDAVSAITIAGEKGAKTVHLVKKDGLFVVADKNDYPADVSKINALISQCLDIRTHEKITSDPANHADLKVTPATARAVVSFLDGEGKEIVGLAVSDSDEKGTGFARLLSGNEVYSIQQTPWIDASVMGYANTALVDVPKDKILSVAVQASDQEYILRSSEDGSAVLLENMPEGKQFKGTTYKTVFGALSSLSFEDVTASAIAPSDMQFDSLYLCKLKDLTVYKLSLAQKDGKTWAKVSADYLDKTDVTKTVGQVESEEELKKKEAKLLAIDAVNAFNQRHEDWIYQIPSYTAGDLTKPLSELIEDLPAGEEGAETPKEAIETAAEPSAEPNAVQ